MRSVGRGHVINISSAAGLVARGGSGIYAATKFAVEAISEAFFHELTPLGVKVTVVEPGPFRTDFNGRSMHMAAHKISDYDGTAGVWREETRKADGRQPGDPEKAAEMIIRAVETTPPPLHLVLGTKAMGRATEKLRALLGEIEQWREPSAATDYQ